MNPNKTFHSPSPDHTAKYLIVLGTEQQTRALLFADDHRYLAEVIDDDDGLMLENLIRAGTMCPPPSEVAARALMGGAATMRCFALG